MTNSAVKWKWLRYMDIMTGFCHAKLKSNGKWDQEIGKPQGILQLKRRNSDEQWRLILPLMEYTSTTITESSFPVKSTSSSQGTWNQVEVFFAQSLIWKAIPAQEKHEMIYKIAALYVCGTCFEAVYSCADINNTGICTTHQAWVSWSPQESLRFVGRTYCP